MRIDTYLDRYAAHRPISAGCLANYRKHVRKLEAFLGRPVTLSELDAFEIDRFLTALIRAGKSPYYVHAIRASILAIWTAAFLDKRTPTRPKLLAIRRPQLLVKCWTPDDVGALVKHAREITGHFPVINCHRSVYLETAISASWYSGLRRGDLHRLRYDDVRADGSFAVVQHKTGRRHVGRIPIRIIDAAQAISSPPGPIWPRPGRSDEILRAAFRQLVNQVRRQRPTMIDGDWRDIRRSAENTAEALYPGKGHLLAGHERRTFERYYKQTNDSPEVFPADLTLPF